MAVPAPIDPSRLAACLAPFGESRTLPAEAYTSPDVHAWEQDTFFRGWHCIGRSADVGIGEQRAVPIGASSALLVRDADGTLRGFANVCRHRGHELVPCGEVRTGRAITCPYHLWSYRHDGALIAAAHYSDVPDFDFRLEDWPLLPIAVREWHGWVFVDASGSAGTLEDHLDGLDEHVRDHAPEDLVVAAVHEYDIAANWKVIIENYQECYHCPAIHPALCVVSPPDSGDNWVPGAGAWVGGWLALRDDAVTMSMDGTSPVAPLPGLSDDQRRCVNYVGVFPNLLISLHPDYVMTHRLTPLAPDRTRVECAWAFSHEAVATPGFDPAFAVDFWDLTNRQDWAACESVQRGLASGHMVPGPLSPREDAIYQFDTMVARGYLGEVPRPTPPERTRSSRVAARARAATAG